MKTDLKIYQDFVRQTLLDIARLDEAGEILEHLVEREPKFAETEPGVFKSEYTFVHFALACFAWVNCCEQNKVEDSTVEKCFLKEVMSRFETPDSLTQATCFSEYWTALENCDEEPGLVRLCRKFLQRLNLQDKIDTCANQKELTAGFQALVETFEGIRVGYENRFQEAGVWS